MRKSIVMLFALAACCGGAFAQTPKLPVQSDDQGSIYVNPNVSSTERSLETKGATLAHLSQLTGVKPAKCLI